MKPWSTKQHDGTGEYCVKQIKSYRENIMGNFSHLWSTEKQNKGISSSSNEPGALDHKACSSRRRNGEDHIRCDIGILVTVCGQTGCGELQ